MSYIGKIPTVGNFQVCDAISVVNNQAAYTMQVGSVNVSPESANHMIVSLNGVIQKPTDAYTVSGSTITFASNLVTGDVINFIQILGNVLDLGVPSDATVSTAKIVDGAVTSAKLAYNPNSFRNIIINGDMSIAQRATSVTGNTAGGYTTVDRWNTILTTAGTYSISQSSENPDGKGFAKSMKFDCTTADASLAAGDNLRLQGKFEGQNLQYLRKGTGEAQSLALSFWVKSNKTGTYIVELEDKDNTRKISKSYTINVANTWEKKTLTYAGDTTGAFNNDNNRSLDLMFWLAAGSTFSGGSTLNTSWGAPSTADRAVGQVNLSDSTSNDWYITGVQLEAGTSASDFEFLPHDVNLQRCLRYFANIFGPDHNDQGNATSFFTSSRAFFRLPFLVEMRADPTVGTSGVTALYAQNGSTGTTTTFANTFPNKTSASVEISGTFNTTYSGHVDISGTGIMTVDSEL